MVGTPPPRRYNVAELKHLAKSPLVKKPDGLPPIEEWMGPPPAARPQATRARTDGDALPGSNDDRPSGITAARRPSFFESRLSRSSIPEDIVLGPPKMSFASSSARTPSGKIESDPFHVLASPALDDDRVDSPRFERFKLGLRDKEPRGFERGDPRGNPFKRVGGKEEGEGWTSVSRPRKSFGAEDGERFRQELRGNREKKESPWDRDPRAPRGDKDNDREHRPRGKRDESSWLLDDHRDRHREHQRFGSRAEKDPEWMDSGVDGKVGGESKGAHSMEEFQRWKERMKANGGSTEPKKKIEELIAKAPERAQPVEEQRIPSPEEKQVLKDSPKEEESGGVALGGVSLLTSTSIEATPLPEPEPVENGVDRFFASWGSSPGIKSPEQDEALSPSRAEPKAIGRSRFTSFFTQPQVSTSPVAQESPSKSPAHASTPPTEATNEDKEGFQRILKMLGGANITDPVSTSALRPPRSSVSPGLRTGITSTHQPPPFATQAPLNPPPAKDPNADFLLRLMQQNQPQHAPQPQQSLPPLQNHYSGPSQMPPPPPIDTGTQSFGRMKPNNNPMSPPFDDPAIAVYRQRSIQESSPIFPRGPPMMDQQGPPSWAQQQPHVTQPPTSQAHRQLAPPPGLRSQQQHHQQGPPPPPPHFMGGPPPGVNGPLPFQLMGGNGPLNGGNLPGSFPPPPHMFMSMNGGGGGSGGGGMNGLNGLNGLNNLNGLNGGLNGLNGGGGGPPMPGPQGLNGLPGGFPMPFAHQHQHHPMDGPGLMGGGPHNHGVPFGFPQSPHDATALKSPQFGHGAPGKKFFRPI